MAKADGVVNWLVDNGFPYDFTLVATPAPLWLLLPVARRWWSKDDYVKPLDSYIDYLTNEQRWEEIRVSNKTREFYPIVQIRDSSIVGVVQAELDGDFLIHYEKGGVERSIIANYNHVMVLDGVRFVQRRVSGE